MSQVITAVYEHGVLNPLTPLGLHEHQRVHVQIVPEARQDTIEHVLEWLTRIGRISPPQHAEDAAPCSDTERAQLAQALGKAISEPLSTAILDERGTW
jgi:predicted DNA-binding antitoxin AbrB/MazE fold protein